jgi:hypothetical protein
VVPTDSANALNSVSFLIPLSMSGKLLCLPACRYGDLLTNVPLIFQIRWSITVQF